MIELKLPKTLTSRLRLRCWFCKRRLRVSKADPWIQSKRRHLVCLRCNKRRHDEDAELAEWRELARRMEIQIKSIGGTPATLDFPMIPHIDAIQSHMNHKFGSVPSDKATVRRLCDRKGFDGPQVGVVPCLACGSEMERITPNPKYPGSYTFVCPKCSAPAPGAPD
jgi:hypothetical protein